MGRAAILSQTAKMNDEAYYQERFRRMVAANAAYWLKRVQAHTDAAAEITVDALRGEQANLMKAVERALMEPSARAAAISLTVELYPLVELLGWWADWRAYLDQGLQVTSPQSAEAATLWQQLAELHYLSGDLETAKAHGELALALWQALGNPLGMAYAYSVLSLVYARLRQLEQAFEVCEQAVRALEGSENPDSKIQQSLLGRIHNNWGIVCENLEDFAEALMHNEQAEVHLRQAGQLWKLPRLWHNRGSAYRYLGRPAEAEEAFVQAAAGHEANHDIGRRSLALHQMAILAHERGDSAHALLLVAEAESGLQQIGIRFEHAWLYNSRGEFYKALHRFEDAEAALQEALVRWQALGEPPQGVTTSLFNLAELYALWGRPQEARQLLLAARARLYAMAQPSPSLMQWVETLAAQLGEA